MARIVRQQPVLPRERKKRKRTREKKALAWT
jgi:hypothetical protein